MILLINPPITKPCEPPSGLAQLAGALCANDIQYRFLDANLEGLLYLLKKPVEARDTWTKRTIKHRDSNLESLRNPDCYGKFDRYKKTVLEVNRLLNRAAGDNVRVSLEDYEHSVLSPVKTDDLLHAAQHPDENPFYPYFSDRFHKVIKEKRPRFIGFSLSYLSQALCCLAMTGFVKTRFPDIQIVFGGSLLTSWMKSPVWKNPFDSLVDHLVCGPGELPLLSLFNKDMTQAASHYRPTFNFENIDNYLAPGVIMPYSTSTGCYWGKCAFCPERAEGNKYISRPPQTVVLELRELVEEVRPALIHLTDNAISPAVLKALAENPPEAPWYGFVRVTNHLADHDFRDALKRSGCVMLKLGVESGDQKVLDAMNKENNISLTSQVLKSLSRAGIATYVYLLFGTPCESEKEARTTLDFIVRHSSYIDFLNLAIFNLPLMSPDSERLKRSSFYEGDLSLYSDFAHPKGWDRVKVRRFLDNEFKKHPAIRPILQRQPPLFTSNHAPFFTKLFIDFQTAGIAK